LNCFRCDEKGQYKNEFGPMEKYESCQRKDMTFEKADEQDSDDQYDWEKIKEKDGRKPKGQNADEQKQRVKKYKKEQQIKKKRKKPKKY